MNLSDEAVSAALEVSLRQLGLSGKELPKDLVEARRTQITEILEAAAPYMLPVVSARADLDALPVNSVILDAEGLPLHKDDSDRIEEWCYGDNAVDVLLPAKVLYTPNPYRSPA